MTLRDFQDAFALLLSGLAEQDGSVKWEDDGNNEIFIFFPTKSPREAIIRQYYKNGNKRYETEFKNGMLNGKHSSWYENGNKQWNAEFANGKLHGKDISWYDDGRIIWEKEYKNGRLINERK